MLDVLIDRELDELSLLEARHQRGVADLLLGGLMDLDRGLRSHYGVTRYFGTAEHTMLRWRSADEGWSAQLSSRAARDSPISTSSPLVCESNFSAPFCLWGRRSGARYAEHAPVSLLIVWQIYPRSLALASANSSSLRAPDCLSPASRSISAAIPTVCCGAGGWDGAAAAEATAPLSPRSF